MAGEYKKIISHFRKEQHDQSHAVLCFGGFPPSSQSHRKYGCSDAACCKYAKSRLYLWKRETDLRSLLQTGSWKNEFCLFGSPSQVAADGLSLIHISLETMEVYAPLAHRLGIRGIKEELEDLSLRCLDGIAYEEIEKTLALKKEERTAFLNRMKEKIRERVTQEHKNVYIEGRVKSIYGIYRKVYMNGRALSLIHIWKR